MKITKKIFSVVITVMMIMSLMICGQAASFSDVEATHKNYTAITTLADMGIINGYTDGTFKPDNAVTRAEMAKLISVLYGYDVNSVAKSPFTDVADDHWAVTFIATMKDVGIINGMGDGTFLPNNEVTYEQSLKMIVCALNWGEIAAQASTPEDWSLGYRQQALKLGITKGVVVDSNSSPAPRGTIAQLLYNSLDAKRAEKVVDANGQVSFKPADKPISEEKSIFELNGLQIVSTPTQSIDGKFIKDGYVRFVDGVGNTYEMSVGSNTDLLTAGGRYADIKYQKDPSTGDLTVSSCSLLGTEETLNIKTLKDVTNSYIEYYVDEEYERTKKINLENITVIYNNRVLKNPSDFVNLIKNDAGLVSNPDDQPLNYFGDIKIVDSSWGELITVKAYKSYYVSSAVDTTNSLVTFDGLKNKVAIPVTNKENYEIVRKGSLTGNPTTPSSISISTNSVVSICMSPDNAYGTKYIEYIPVTAKTHITPTTVSTPYGPDKKTVEVGDTKYTVVNDAAAAQFEVGATTTCILDASGAVVYVTAVSAGNKKFVLFKSAQNIDKENRLPVTFYDLENLSSTVNVTIEDQSDIDFLSANKGELLWISITSSNKVKKGDIKLAKNVTTSDDTNITANVAYNEATSVKLSSAQYTLTGALDTSKTKYATTNGTVIARPDAKDLGSNSLIFKKITMATGTPYNNPKVYEIKKKDRTYVYVITDAFKGLQYSTPIYVVKEDPTTKAGSIESPYYPVSCYDFKKGDELTAPLKIEAGVAEKLMLKEGDIFTFYSDSEDPNVDIDKLDNVFVLLRASELAANKAKAKDLGYLTNDKNAKVKTDGFRTFGIYESNIESTYYSATLQLPIYVDRENSMIYFARQAGSNSIKPENFVSYVHGDDVATLLEGISYFGGDKSSDIVEAFGSNVVSSKVTSSTRVYIYNKAATDGNKLTVYKSPSTNGDVDTLAATLDAIETLQNIDNTDAAAFNANIQNASLTYGYFSTTSSNPTLNALVIIK